MEPLTALTNMLTVAFQDVTEVYYRTVKRWGLYTVCVCVCVCVTETDGNGRCTSRSWWFIILQGNDTMSMAE